MRVSLSLIFIDLGAWSLLEGKQHVWHVGFLLGKPDTQPIGSHSQANIITGAKTGRTSCLGMCPAGRAQ